MSAYVVGSLIGGGFVLAGAAITAAREAAVRRSVRRDAQAVQLAAAMRELLAALDAFAIELEDEPTPPKRRRTNRALDWIAQRSSLDILVHILVRASRRLAYGRRREELVDRLTLASAELRLIAPPGVLDVIQRIPSADTGDLSGARWRANWFEIRGEIRDAFREHLALLQRESWHSRALRHLRRPRAPLFSIEPGSPISQRDSLAKQTNRARG
jgi:hypothetical protein